MLIDFILKMINHLGFFIKKVFLIYKYPSFEKQLNRLKIFNTSKKTIVFIDTDCIVGGSQKITSQLGKSLKNLNIRTIYIATEFFGISKDWKNKILNSFSIFIDIRASFNKEKKILKLLKTVHPQYVVIINSKIGYKLAPIIKNLYPKIIIYDIIHASINIDNDFISADESAQNIDIRITVCKGLKKNLLENYSSYSKNNFQNKIITITNGTQINNLNDTTTNLNFRNKLGINQKDFVVLFIGIFSEHKNPMSVLKISEKIIKDYNDIHFILFGNGPLKNLIKYNIYKRGISNNTHVIDNSNDIYSVLYDADVLILPSLVESFGLVIIEAMSVGIPTIVSNVGYQSEIIDNGINGFLINPDNNLLHNYIKNILLLKNNKNIYKKIKINGLKKVKNKFDINSTLNKYHELFIK
tara:strand:- start:23933 stop:25168 length:1236 start_codon:yes stop_codon:yes gene_type:complete